MIHSYVCQGVMKKIDRENWSKVTLSWTERPKLGTETGLPDTEKPYLYQIEFIWKYWGKKTFSGWFKSLDNTWML